MPPAPAADSNDTAAETYSSLYDVSFELTFRLIQELEAEVQANNAVFAVAVASSDRNLVLGEDNSRFTERLDALGIPYLDLLPVILAEHSPERPMHMPCDGHWTASGHAVVAGQLAPFLTELTE